MSIKEYREQMSQNRNTLYHYFKDAGLYMRFLQIGKGRYKVFQCPWEWEKSYLLVNDFRVTDFDALILFSNELVVRFDLYNDMQINIPYKSIKTIEVRENIDIGYQELHLNK